MEGTRVKFNTKSNPDFLKELRSRVNTYFKENNISKYGNINMVIKTLFMLALYLTPYFLVIFNVFENTFFCVFDVDFDGNWYVRNWLIHYARCQPWGLFKK